MKANFSWIYLCLSFFGIISVEKIGFSAERWPLDIFLTHPYIVSIGPGRTYSFVSHSGFTDFLEAPIQQRFFNFLLLGEEWLHPKACSESARKHGYLHSMYIGDGGDDFLGVGKEKIKIAIPIHLKIKATASENRDLSQLRKQRILNWPLLNLSVLHLKESGEFESILVQEVPVRSLNSHSQEGTNAEDLNVSFDGVFVSQEVNSIAGRNFRIRLEWSSDGICDENEFEFKMGDQFRIIRVVN